MLNKLKFEVEFTSTGRVIKDEHDFQLGMSAITGKNESGKSLRLEMIRYALFGTPALRAEISGYKKIKVELNFTVGKDTYDIARSKKDCLLKKNAIDLATGTKPVNQTIVQRVLGYDLEVFDVANACLQGEIEAMTNKTPAERKRMVDRTIGLDAIDRVLTDVNSDSRGGKQSKELLTSRLNPHLVKPELPTHLTALTVDKLDADILSLNEQIGKKNKIEGILEASKCNKPVCPVLSAEEEAKSSEDLQKAISTIEVESALIPAKVQEGEQFLEIQKSLDGAKIEKIFKFCDKSYRQAWSDYEAYQSSTVERPFMLKEDLTFLSKAAAYYSQKNHEIECPKCKAKFSLESVDSSEQQPEPDKKVFDDLRLKYVPMGGTIEPILDDAELAWREYDRFTDKVPVVKPDLEKEFDKPELLVYKKQLEDNFLNYVCPDLDELRERQTQLIEVSNDLRKKLIARKEEEAAIELYRTGVKAYEDYLLLVSKHSVELKSYDGTQEKFNLVIQHRQELKSYEDEFTKYKLQMEVQLEIKTDIEKIDKELDQLDKVSKGLKELKPRVKTHLLPSLNQVSSALLSEMTNGVRTAIVVDENFEINVDGQPVKTLSGSGKAIANLAVRIALGTVLTNKVFSVFMADEIDASMDSERAEATAECLRNLTNTFSQIILVSHKEPECDHQIILT